ncbi:MAG: glycoside hydrolase family 78 protein [Victivallales bacterium]|nr:glycoside hydrolase family 78 protein [Victivallales bacterium]
MNRNINWQARWIGVPDRVLTLRSSVLPAPFFRKVFNYDGKSENCRIYISGLGYYELYLNGRKVGDHVLDPVVTQYDKRIRYVVYDVTEYLVVGENVIGVILGNGWYNCHTPEVWYFDKAPWRDQPKLLLEMKANNRVILISDESWKINSGPIVFDGLRNGETYDARKELDGWLMPGYDDSSWRNASRVAPPGGILAEQIMPPCKVMQTLPAVNHWMVSNGSVVYDFGQNLAGWVRLTVAGNAGDEITIRYGERLAPNYHVDQKHISQYIYDQGNFQTDRYILKGKGVETWEPRFTYHGFQYAQLNISGDVQVKNVEARIVRTAFEQIGHFSCSNEMLNRLQECTVWSYISNFVGIPTDCPHREKNGWTGDTQLATETGLMNFKAASSYSQWLDNFPDVQRPSGQLPGIVPSCGWGYNWGSGPAWDSALILIPWYVYLYTGDCTAIEKHYESMKRYVDYCTYMADDHIVSFGLGDWLHVDAKRIAPPALTSTGYYYIDSLLLAKFAGMIGRREDQEHYVRLAADIKIAFNRRFYQGNGIYAQGEQTALACALYQGLTDDSEKAFVVQKLVETVKANGAKPDFGILGAKYVPRALAENGHVELAYQMLTQPEFPGWVNWLRQGATTLWEDWDGNFSRNHIAFGDISAWFYQYLAGIKPDPENPGFKHIIIHPQPVSGLEWVKAEYDSPYGKIIVAWENHNNDFKLEVQIPDKTMATVNLPDGTIRNIEAGNYHFKANFCVGRIDELENHK